MSTATATPTIATSANFSVAPRLSFLRLVRSEWRKLFSLRSLLITFGITLAIGVLVPILIAFALDANENPRFALMFMTQVPITLQALLLLAIGVLIVSTEFTKNAAITTFVTAPRRLQVLAAKGVVLMAITTLVWLTTMVVALAAGFIRFDIADAASEAAPTLMWALGYLAFFAFLGFFFAAILRSSAGAITSAVGLIYVLPLAVMMLASFFPTLETVAKYLPLELTNRLLMPSDMPHPLSVGLAALLLLVYLGIAGAAGSALLQRRDIN